MSVLNIRDPATGEFKEILTIRGPKGDTPVKGVDYFTESDISEIKESVTTEVTEAISEISIPKPTETPTVGKVLKVRTVNADGSFVVEWADDNNDGSVTDVKVNNASIVTDGVANVPIATQNAVGLVRPADGLKTSASGGIFVVGAGTTEINAKETNNMAICPKNLDYAVRAALGAENSSIIYDDSSKDNACNRIGAERKKGDWVLKGTISGTADDRGNIDSGVTVDLTGCTELFVNASAIVTATTSLRKNASNLIIDCFTTSRKTVHAHFADNGLGHEPLAVGYSSTYGNNSTLATTNLAYITLGMYISDISSLKFNNPNNVTSCEIKIYAR